MSASTPPPEPTAAARVAAPAPVNSNANAKSVGKTAHSQATQKGKQGKRGAAVATVDESKYYQPGKYCYRISEILFARIE